MKILTFVTSKIHNLVSIQITLDTFSKSTILSFNCLLLLLFMLCINLLKMISNKRKCNLHQKGSKYKYSDHIFNYDFFNFINYLLIKLFYNVNLTNIYKLSYTKFDISNMTMTGITSVTPSPFNPLSSTFNFSVNPYIDGNNISLITLQTNYWVLILFIMIVSVLLFSLLMYLNYKIYFKKVKKSKVILKNKKTKV